MPAVPPPEGMSEHDYGAIEAAVMETVRGRWFLAEYAQRIRASEVRQMLDAVARLERAVLSQPVEILPPPSASLQMRLMSQRLDEIAKRLQLMAGDFRAENLDPRFSARLEGEARAIQALFLDVPSSKAGPKSLEAPAAVQALPEPTETEELKSQAAEAIAAEPEIGAQAVAMQPVEMQVAETEASIEIADAAPQETADFSEAAQEQALEVLPETASQAQDEAVVAAAEAPQESQDEIALLHNDAVVDDESFEAEASELNIHEPTLRLVETTADPRLAAIAWIDSLPIEQKLALFA
jgi:hypothetical protein